VSHWEKTRSTRPTIEQIVTGSKGGKIMKKKGNIWRDRGINWGGWAFSERKGKSSKWSPAKSLALAIYKPGKRGR